MAKKKTDVATTQNYANTATYGQIQPESNKYIDDYANYKPQIDPSIAYGAADSKNRFNSSFINPLSGKYSATMQDALKRAGNREIDQNASQAFRLGQYDQNQQIGGQKGALAALMAPRIVQQGSSGTSSGTSKTVQGNNLFGDIMEVGQGAAGMAMM